MTSEQLDFRVSLLKQMMDVGGIPADTTSPQFRAFYALTESLFILECEHAAEQFAHGLEEGSNLAAKHHSSALRRAFHDGIRFICKMLNVAVPAIVADAPPGSVNAVH